MIFFCDKINTKYYKVFAYGSMNELEKKYIKKIIMSAVAVAMFGTFALAVSAEVKIGCVDNLDADKQSKNSISLVWNKGINADGYVIERKETGSKTDYVKIAKLNDHTKESYIDKSVKSGKKYTYRVKSYIENSDDTLIYSKAEMIDTASSPEKVKKLDLSVQNEKSISLKWDKVKGATGYTIYRADGDGKQNYKKVCDVKDAQKYTDKGLNPATKYCYYISAYIEVNGERSYSEKSNIIITATNPSQVQNLVTSKKGEHSLTIKWDKSENASGYVIYRMTNNEDDYEGEWIADEYGDYYYSTRVGKYIKYAVISGGDKTSYTNKNLNACQGYYYRVVPYYKSDNKYYYGDYRGIATGTVTQKPKSTVFSRAKRVMAKWYPVYNADGYEVYISDSKNGKYKSQGTTTDNIFLTKQLEVGKTYYVRVCSYYKLDDGTKVYSNYDTQAIKCTAENKVDEYTVGTTYIEIDLDMQHMWYFEKGKLVVSTDVVTGMKYNLDTSRGLFEIYNKESPARLVGETWDTMVNYWMAVTYDGQGIHDSTWRYDYEYGGDTYTYDGSHGCINTPYNKVEEMYELVEIGTPVVIYQEEEY